LLPKFGGKYVVGKYRVKFGNFVNFSYIISGKNVFPKVA